MSAQGNQRRSRRWSGICLIAILSLLLVAADAQPFDPVGGQVYDYVDSGSVSQNASSRINLTFDTQQVISILVKPTGFKPRVTFSSGETVIAEADAQESGQPVLLQSILLTNESLAYTVEIQSLESGGNYELFAISATLEEEPFTNKPNNISAERIGTSFIAYDGVQRGAVRGEFADEQDEDLFSFRLVAGEHVELVFSSAGAGGALLELLNPSNQPVGTAGGSSNLSQMVIYDVPANGAGTYSARLQAGPSISMPTAYNLLVVRGGLFSEALNASFDSAQVLTGTVGKAGGVLGSVNVPPMDGTVKREFDEAPLKVHFSSSGAFAYSPGGSLNDLYGLKQGDVEFLRTGDDELSSFTYCYQATCPVHQDKAAGSRPKTTYQVSALGVHDVVMEGRSGPLHYTRVARWRTGDSRIVITTQLVNTGGSALNGVYALESINPNPNPNPDPDPLVHPDPLSSTNNDVAPAPGNQTNVALAWNDHGAMILGTSDPRAVAGFFTPPAGSWANLETILPDLAAMDPNNANSNQAMHLVFDLDSIPAGGRADFTFVVALGATKEEAQSQFDAAEPGKLLAGLDDLYAIDLTAGKKLVLRTVVPYRRNGTTYRNNLDPVLKLYGPDRGLLVTNDDCAGSAANHDCLPGSPEARIELTPSQSGRYYIQVTNSSKPALFGPASAPTLPESRAGGEYVLLFGQSSAPSITAIPDVTVKVGQMVSVNVVATDPDGDELVYRLGAGAPPGAAFDPSLPNLLVWTPTHPGVYPITVVVSDRPAWLEARAVFQVRVMTQVFLPAVIGE